MAAKQKKKEDLEAEVWNAISAFEQILEAMPNDRASLEALSHAYEQIGDLTKAKDYIVRLANIVLEENDTEIAAALIDKLKVYAAEDSDIAELLSRIESVSEAAPKEKTPAKSGEKGGEKKASQARATFNMAEELAMAWNLLEAKQLSQEEYASVVQDLTEMSAGESAATISVLHVLEARGFKSLEKIIGFLVKECRAPFVTLSCFDLQTEAVQLIPYEFSLRRGALVYELMGKNALAVVMNPYDKQLRQDVESITGMKCHFCLALPSDFDQTLLKIQELLGAANK